MFSKTFSNLISLLLVVLSLSTLVHADTPATTNSDGQQQIESSDALDAHLLYDPVTFQLSSYRLVYNDTYFPWPNNTDPTTGGVPPGNYTALSLYYGQQMLNGIMSYILGYPMNQTGSTSEFGACYITFPGTYMDDLNMSASASTAGINTSVFSNSTQTTWTFTLSYNESYPTFNPYPSYENFVIYCNPQSNGYCQSDAYRYVGDQNSAQGILRQWLPYIDAINLECCDGTWRSSRAACPDCNAKNVLPLILGLSLGFAGAVILGVLAYAYCHHQKKKRRGIKDAGHKAPPRSLEGAFPVAPHSYTPNPSPSPAHSIQMSAVQFQHQQQQQQEHQKLLDKEKERKDKEKEKEKERKDKEKEKEKEREREREREREKEKEKDRHHDKHHDHKKDSKDHRRDGPSSETKQAFSHSQSSSAYTNRSSSNSPQEQDADTVSSPEPQRGKYPRRQQH